MTITSPCVSRNRLQEFTLGYLDDEESSRIEVHLQECPACDETLAQLDEATDSLLRELRCQPAASQYADDSQCQQAIDRVQTIDLVQPESNGKLSATMHSESDGQLLRDYRLTRVIGSGGMGTVYQAMHTRLQRPVAVKVLPERRLRDPAAVMRFQREMLTIGKLDHPAIVRATDAGEVDGTHFLVMELIEGIDLSRLVKIGGALLAADACELVRQAAEGIEYSHRLGIVHRDIKPSNLMLNRNGQVKILDLGLAMLGGLQNPVDELTTVGQLM